MHGSVSAVASLQKADVVIAVGTRFDDRVTGDVESFAPEAKFIHADIDPAEIGKIREVEVPIVGDAQVWPMVASGHSKDVIQYALNLRPLFDSDQMIDEDSVTDVSDVIEEDQARVAAEGTTAATDDQRGGGEE